VHEPKARLHLQQSQRNIQKKHTKQTQPSHQNKHSINQGGGAHITYKHEWENKNKEQKNHRTESIQASNGISTHAKPIYFLSSMTSLLLLLDVHSFQSICISFLHSL